MGATVERQRAPDRVRRARTIASRWASPRRTPRAGGVWIMPRRDVSGVWVIGESILGIRRVPVSASCRCGRDSVIILKKGLTVTGRVVDAAGRPVRGARAFIGDDSFDPFTATGTTNEQGEFTVEHCTAGPKIVTVQAEGFAPQVADIRVDERTAPVEIQLTEPGSVIRGKVVDIEGKPVAGAWFGAGTWRGHRSIHFHVKTEKDGRFEWKNAPKDVVLYSTGKFGYMSSRDVPLTAADREQVITLYPELVISGRVTDAETGPAGAQLPPDPGPEGLEA